MQAPPAISTVAYDGYPLKAALEQIAGLGVRRVEIAYISGYMDPFQESEFTPARSRELVRALVVNGLDCVAFSSHLNLGLPSITNTFLRRMDFAASVGARIVVSNAAPRTDEAQFLRNMEQITEAAARRGLRVALENPGSGPPDLCGSGQEAADLIAKLQSPWVGLNYDFANTVTYGRVRSRPEEDMLPALPHCLHFHLKDVVADPHTSCWVYPELGRGTLDFRRILSRLHAVDSPFSLEIPVRVRRGFDGTSTRLPEPLPLEHINTMLRGSLEYLHKATIARMEEA